MKKDNKFNTLKNLTLISQLGISAITPMILGVLLGNFLDKKLGTKGVFSIILLIIGAASGMYSIFKIAIPRDKNEDDKNEQ